MWRRAGCRGCRNRQGATAPVGRSGASRSNSPARWLPGVVGKSGWHGWPGLPNSIANRPGFTGPNGNVCAQTLLRPPSKGLRYEKSPPLRVAFGESEVVAC